ncbi:hypothetical protein WJX84_008491 [Apatococcus fuscideae]|uniref:Uncharacterized protein n=1 Tax=Apatococcus fuscideae TaxID=2026836 RepID=A0AAW1SX98_9CHLO
MFHSQLSNGINLLAEFHWRLHHAFQPSVLLPAGAPAEVLRVENNLANIQDHAALQHVPAPACIPHAQQLRNGIRAGLAVSVLLVLKKYLKEAFSLAPDRVIAFEPKSEARKQEEKVPAVRDVKTQLYLNKLHLNAADEPELIRKAYKALKALLEADAADYRAAAQPSIAKAAPTDFQPAPTPRGLVSPGDSETPAWAQRTEIVTKPRRGGSAKSTRGLREEGLSLGAEDEDDFTVAKNINFAM